MLAALRAIVEYIGINASDRFCASHNFRLIMVFTNYCSVFTPIANWCFTPTCTTRSSWWMPLPNTKSPYYRTLPLIVTLFATGMRLRKNALPHLRKITNTGGHLPETVIDQLHAQLPTLLEIVPAYGLTESNAPLSAQPVRQRKTRFRGIPGHARHGCQNSSPH